MILFAVALAAFVWLTVRHAPWTAAAHVWHNGHPLTFAGKHHFITVSPQNVDLWHAHSGEHVRTIHRNTRLLATVSRVFEDDTHLLVAFHNHPVLQISKSDDPKVRSMSEPVPLSQWFIAAAPAAGRFITSDKVPNYFHWDVSRPEPRTAPYEGFHTDIFLSADGRSVVRSINVFNHSLIYFDFAKQTHLPEIYYPQGTKLIRAHPDFLIAQRQRIELRDPHTLQVRHSIPRAAWGPAWKFELTPDARIIALVFATGTGPSKTQFYELKDARLLATYDRGWTGIKLFPDSQRVFCYDPPSRKPAIFRIGTKHPVALLDNTHDWDFGPIINQDGSLLALVGHGEATIYRRTGPDCPESPIGVLAFPHTWLLIFVTTALALSLHKDARQQSLNLDVESWTLKVGSSVLLLLALPRSLHLLLTAATQHHLLLTPAPLLLLAAIGLAANSRFWRFATLTLLALQLPLNLYFLRLLHKSGLAATTPTAVLDRTWPVPHLAVLIPLALATIAIPFAIYQLSRTPRDNF